MAYSFRRIRTKWPINFMVNMPCVLNLLISIWNPATEKISRSLLNRPKNHSEIKLLNKIGQFELACESERLFIHVSTEETRIQENPTRSNFVRNYGTCWVLFYLVFPHRILVLNAMVLCNSTDMFTGLLHVLLGRIKS
jgi:hypothetical protein